MFKDLGKKIVAIIDDDADNSVIIHSLSEVVNVLFVSQKDYEDLIIDDVKNVLHNLSDIIPFDKLKSKFESIINKDKTKGKEHLVCNHLKTNNNLIENLNKYEDLCNQDILLKFVLHDSFATPYYSRALANTIAESKVPAFFNNMISHLDIKNEYKLPKYSNNEDSLNNVYKLVGTISDEKL